MDINEKLGKWIAVYTKPRHEKTVADYLKKKGFKIYLPLVKERRKWSDRKKWVQYPLFKSYLFVKIQIKDSIFIIQTPGIVNIIKFGNEIATVNSKTISALKLMISGNYNPTSTDYFIKGEPVIVKNGPLKGIQGEVARIDENDRLILRIESIQNSISVKINRAFLSKLK